ncbi:UvrD/REP helicase, partial [mine drainage metagenome]
CALGHETIAVICKTAAQSRAAHAAIEKRQAVQLITKHSATFAKGTLIIPAYLAKGVEFDAVIIYDASDRTYGDPDDRKLFYTACTRAMHALHIHSLGNPNAFLRGADPATYEGRI